MIKKALKQDIHLIQINCFLFNDPKKAVICDYVKEVTDSIIAFLEGKTKQIMASNSLNNNNYSNRNKKLNEKRKKDVIEEEEEDKSDKNNSIIITRSKKLNHKN